MEIQVSIPEDKLLIDKEAVTSLKADLDRLIRLAMDVTADSSFEAIRKAQNASYRALGTFIVLRDLGLLEDSETIAEDIDRIERKQLSILEEKRRRDIPRWKH